MYYLCKCLNKLSIQFNLIQYIYIYIYVYINKYFTMDIKPNWLYCSIYVGRHSSI